MNYNQFQPGTQKLIYHVEYLNKIINNEIIAPIHLSIWPTFKCQFKCEYCCCKNTPESNNELNINDFKNSIDVFEKYGTKAIEFSGGGEPLLWKDFDEAVNYCKSKNIKLSLITNGIALKDKNHDILNKFDWIRVSLQSINHANLINFKNIPTRISASYIIKTDENLNIIKKLYDFAKENNIVIRIALQRPSTGIREEEVFNEVHKFGNPLFFSKKELGKPLGCYMAWIRAAIDWNGMFLPCPSVQLNEEYEGFIPDNFKLCHINNIEDWLIKNRLHDLKYNCNFCNCGKENNDYIHNLLNGDILDVDFV